MVGARMCAHLAIVVWSPASGKATLDKADGVPPLQQEAPLVDGRWLRGSGQQLRALLREQHMGAWRPTSKMRVDRWIIGGLVAAILITGGVVVYRHVTGPRFEIQLAPITAPPTPSPCSTGACLYQSNAWFRATVTNTGRRGAYVDCTVLAYDVDGGIPYSGPLHVGVALYGAGQYPYFQGGQSLTWRGSLPQQEGNLPYARIIRYVASCRALPEPRGGPGPQ